MLKHVFEFNQNRNAFEYSADAEIKMYDEEVKEFFDAKTFAEKVDAYIDCQFVRYGTEMKLAANGQSTLPYVNQERLMYDILEASFSDKFLTIDHYGQNIACNENQLLAKIIKKAQEIVCKANQLKGYDLDENGKVIKSQAYIDSVKATEQISKMIKKVIADGE